MPEIITRYPDVTLRVLQDAGAQCGVGTTPKILRHCPPARFCTLPTGEVCVLGINELHRAQQVTVWQLLQQPLLGLPAVALVVLIFLLGLRLARSRRPS
ncbi:MAG: hypothetical protein HY567_00055 [Candidatus Kerfeldbacteria bacterium]|nr:hypothetical protein [Candidatus Kerfeldbacteria bacterium]